MLSSSSLRPFLLLVALLAVACGGAVDADPAAQPDVALVAPPPGYATVHHDDAPTCAASVLEGTIAVGRVTAHGDKLNVPVPYPFSDDVAPAGGEPRQDLRIDGTPSGVSEGEECGLTVRHSGRLVASSPLTVEFTTTFEGTRTEGCSTLGFTNLPPASCAVTRTLVYGGPVETSR